MRIEVISTGNEVQQGDIVDTNAAWLSRQLASKGHLVARRHSVADDLTELVALYQECHARADVVICSGGLGPTSDDLTNEALAQALGLPLLANADCLAHLERWREKRGGSSPLSDNMRKQALLPQGAQALANPSGTACGYLLQLDGCQWWVTPGVPTEFKPMITNEILPRLPSASVQLERWYVSGIGESALDQALSQHTLASSALTVGYRASPSLIEIKLSGTAEVDSSLWQQSVQQLDQAIAQVDAQRVDPLFAKQLQGDEPALAQQLHHWFKQQGVTLSLAESCSGGLLADQWVQFSGSSDYFIGSWVTYANAAKINWLGVDEQTIEAHGAVSLSVVGQMAKQAKLGSGSDYALAISGVAGPGGGSVEKPVGTVTYSVMGPQKRWDFQVQHRSSLSRTQIRTQACALAMWGLYQMIQERSLEALGQNWPLGTLVDCREIK